MEIDELIQQIDIVEFISQYVELEQRGSEYWGLSCFKEENTPSFSVRSQPPVFYDYSSGIGGNVFSFVKYYHKCSGWEAVEILKRYVKKNCGSEGKRRNLDMVTDCKRFKQTKGAEKKFLAKELPNNYMERFEKAEDKLKQWEQEGISRDILDKFQVYYDRFSNRLVYPIRSLEGKIVNIGGRTLEPKFKEMGLRKYTYFQPWGSINTLYGLYEGLPAALEKKEIILFEGCKSVLLANTWGIQNVAAILTSHLSPNQMKILAKMGCRVVFALDKDVDIEADKNIQKLKRYVNVEYLKDDKNVLGEKDAPVDKGEDVFRSLYENRRKLNL